MEGQILIAKLLKSKEKNEIRDFLGKDFWRLEWKCCNAWK